MDVPVSNRFFHIVPLCSFQHPPRLPSLQRVFQTLQDRDVTWISQYGFDWPVHNHFPRGVVAFNCAA
jgi:hypothetical protein